MRTVYRYNVDKIFVVIAQPSHQFVHFKYNSTPEVCTRKVTCGLTLKVTYPKYASLAPSTNTTVDSLSRSMITWSNTLPGAEIVCIRNAVASF